MASEQTIKTAEKVLGIATIGGDAAGHGTVPKPFLTLRFYKDGSVIPEKDFSEGAAPETAPELLALLGCVTVTLRDVTEMVVRILNNTHRSLMTTTAFLEGFRPGGKPS